MENCARIGIRDDIRNSLLNIPPVGGDDRTVALLTTNLTQVRHLQATNPEDKIYGLHAVFSTLGFLLPAPNYGK